MPYVFIRFGVGVIAELLAEPAIAAGLGAWDTDRSTVRRDLPSLLLSRVSAMIWRLSGFRFFRVRVIGVGDRTAFEGRVDFW